MTAVALRIYGFLGLLVVAGSVVTFLLTGNRRWLRFGLQCLKYGLLLALLVVAFLAFERLVIAI